MTEDVHPVAVRGDRHLDLARLWTCDTVLQWHAVLITADSISGIPDTVSQQCDSCRVTLPTFAVDSLQVGYAPRRPDAGSDDGDGGNEGIEFLLITLLILGTLFGP